MSQTLFEKLRAVREKFRTALTDRLPEASTALEAGSSEGAAKLHRILHELCGTAGMVGEKDLALALDPPLRLAESCAHENRPLSAQEHDTIAAHLARIRALL